MNRIVKLLTITLLISVILSGQPTVIHNTNYTATEQVFILKNQFNNSAVLNSADIPPPDSMGLEVRMTQKWSSDNSRWENSRKTEYEYPNGKILTKPLNEVRRRNNYLWQNEKWESTGYWVDETDGDGNYNKTVSYGSAGSTYQEIYYNAPYTNGQPASWLSLLKSGSEWVNHQRGNYTYNSDGDVTEHIVENWENESWVNNFRGIYTYTQPGCFDQIFWYNYDNETWNVNWRNTYVYGETDCITQMVPFMPWELENCNPTQIINEISTDNGVTWEDSPPDTYSDFGADCLPRTYTGENWNGNQEEKVFEYNTVSGGKISSIYDNYSLRCTKITSKEQIDDTWVNTEKIWLSYKGLMLETKSESTVPNEFVLAQNYPNPFNPITTISFDLPQNTNVNISIYDLLGNEIKALVNQTMMAGNQRITWDGTSDDGKSVSGGVYLYNIQTDHFNKTKKMVLLR